MPNTLTHIAVNGFITKSVLRFSDLLWIYTSCLIPDFPWMSMRLIDIFLGSLNGYDVKVYSIAQASLFMCIVLSASLSLLSKNSLRIFFILSLGSLLHLILDSLQIKWANGVNLFAPISWEMTTFNLFWPENLITYLLSLSGIIFFILNWKQIRSIKPPFSFTKNKFVISGLLLFTYLSLPLLMMDSIYREDLHYLSTLKNYEERPGKYVELDRKRISFNETTNSIWIDAYDGQIIELANVPALSSEKLSIKGKFIERELIEVKEYHENWADFRDGSSYIGIFLIGLVWIIVIRREYF